MSYDRASDTIRLHDVMHKFLRDRAGDDGLKAQNAASARTLYWSAKLTPSFDVIPTNVTGAGKRSAAA